MLRHYLSLLRFRLMIAFGLVALVPLLIVGGYGLRTISSALRDRAFEVQLHEVNNVADSIRSFFQTTSTDAIFLAHSAPLQVLLEAMTDGDPAAVDAARQQLAEEFIALADTRDIYFKLRYLDATGQEIVEVEKDGDVFRISEGDQLQNESGDEYFVNGMTLQEGQVYATRLRLETQGGVIVTPHVPGVRYATPVFYAGQRRGIVVTNVDARPLFGLLQAVEETAIGQGELLLVDEEGYYLWHPDEKKRWGGPGDLDTGESLKLDFPDLQEQLLSSEAGATVARGLILTHLPISLDMPGQPTWTLLESQPEQVVLAPIIRFRNLLLGLMVLALLAALLLGGWLSRGIASPLTDLNRIAARVSAGDLTGDVRIQASGEVGELGRAFAHMTAELRTLLGGITAASGGMNAAAEALATMSEQLHTTAEQISAAVHQVTEGAGNQAQQVEAIAQAVSHLAEAADEIAQNAEETEQVSHQAETRANRLVETMERLQRYSVQIDEMARTVNRFADQTNLLALNAAIEAARAGEHGKSFAVVADEVRHLAESSRQAVDEITSFNAQIQSEMEQMQLETQGIKEIVHQTAALAAQTSQASDRQHQEADSVMQVVTDVASVTEEQTASTEEMATAIEQQMTSIGEIAGAAQEIARTAARLHALITRFRLPSTGESSEKEEG
ncbi:MAG: methyl-accepting chemotaxis protein [Chloroflexi bacterium]|nr:MAG: methyl-accepting chemotaxis protein [Chloroflexota bacterium]